MLRQYESGMSVDAYGSYDESSCLSGFTISSSGYTYRATLSGYLDAPGKAVSSITELIIYDRDGALVYQKSTGYGNDKFKVTYRDGSMHLYITELKYASTDRSKVYDGTALVTENGDCSRIGGILPSGYTERIIANGTLTSAGRASSSFAVEIWQDGENVTDCFLIRKELGSLTVSARSITVTAKSDTKPYDGTPLVCDEVEYDASELASGHVIDSFTISGSQTGVGKSDNVIAANSVIIRDAAGNNVTQNYSVTYKAGELIVTP